jgi:hypothetical protein
VSDYYRCALNVTGDGELSDGGCDAYDDSRFAFTRRARVSSVPPKFSMSAVRVVPLVS